MLHRAMPCCAVLCQLQHVMWSVQGKHEQATKFHAKWASLNHKQERRQIGLKGANEFIRSSQAQQEERRHRLKKQAQKQTRKMAATQKKQPQTQKKQPHSQKKQPHSSEVEQHAKAPAPSEAAGNV